ncbi:MAG: hypothetical protein IJR45_07020 [Firmicutes bacterium]|nr:hypothetical protein [Bacillota bacterium]MBQ9605149.1 hypothetical protein [Bacillota bacterium]
MKKHSINDTTVLFCVMSVIMIVYIIVYLQVKQMSELAVSMSQFSNDVLQYLDSEDAERPQYNYSEVAADNGKCSIQVFGINPEAEEKNSQGCVLKFYFENRSNTRLDFVTELRGINGLYISDGIIPAVEANSSKIAEMFIDKSVLDMHGTDTEKFTDIEFAFKVYNSQDPYYTQKDKNDTADKDGKQTKTEPAPAFEGVKHLYPYGRENVINFMDKRGVPETDKVLIDNDRFTITAAGCEVNKNGIKIDILTSDKTNEDIELTYDEVYINGEKNEIEPMTINAYAGKAAYHSFVFPLPEKFDEEKGVKEIKFVCASDEAEEGKNEADGGTSKVKKAEDKTDNSEAKEDKAEEKDDGTVLIYKP